MATLRETVLSLLSSKPVGRTYAWLAARTMDHPRQELEGVLHRLKAEGAIHMLGGEWWATGREPVPVPELQHHPIPPDSPIAHLPASDMAATTVLPAAPADPTPEELDMPKPKTARTLRCSRCGADKPSAAARCPKCNPVKSKPAPDHPLRKQATAEAKSAAARKTDAGLRQVLEKHAGRLTSGAGPLEQLRGELEQVEKRAEALRRAIEALEAVYA